MAKNLGRIRLERITVDGLAVGVAYSVDSDLLWKDHAPATDGCVYLVVTDDGTVLTGGAVPWWNLIEGYDIWEVEADDYEAFVGTKWEGGEA